MQKKFITNLIFLLFLNLLIKPFWLLGIDRTVQNVTGAEVYGLYFALFNFSFLFNILLDLGISNFNNRNIAQNRHLLQKHLSGIVMIRIALAVVYLVVSLSVALILGYDIVQLKMILILLLNQALISFILYLRSNLAGLHLFRTDSIVSVLDRAIMIVICSWLLWGRTSGTPFRIEWFIWAQTAAYVMTIVFIVVYMSGKVTFLKLKWNPLFALMILKKSYPFAILILLMTFYNRVDSVMIERMLSDGSKQAGIYAQSYRLMEAANMIAFLFAGLLLPMFAHMLKMKENITQLLKLSYSLIARPAIAIAVISVCYSTEIMTLLYHEHINDSATIFPLLMISFFAVATTYIFGTLLTANGNLKQLNRMAMAGMLLNIVLNFILIPHFFARGAAMASLVTQFATAAIQIYLSIKIFNLKINFILAAKYFILAGITALLALAIKELAFSWIISSILIFMFSIGIGLIIRIIDLKSVYLILKTRGE